MINKQIHPTAIQIITPVLRLKLPEGVGVGVGVGVGSGGVGSGIGSSGLMVGGGLADGANVS